MRQRHVHRIAAGISIAIIGVVSTLGSNLSGSQVMTRDVTTCSEDDTCADITEPMTARKFRHLPVVRDCKMVGLISIGDVVKQRVEEIERETEAMRDYIQIA